MASDLLSQAEHGPDSPALLVTWDAGFGAPCEVELGRQLETAARRAILERSLAAGALVVLAPDRGAALDFVNAYAPEHLSVVVDDVEEAVARLRNAGSLFVGPYAPESAGDYASGANHVLPTGGLARSCGALSTESYGKFIQVQRITRDGLATIRDAVEAISEAEGPDRPQARRRDALRGRGGRRSERVPSKTACRPTSGSPRPTSWRRKYGLPRESIVRFDVNTSPVPPDLRDVLAGSFDPPLCEYPPSDYAALVAAAAESYGVAPDELLPTAGADEALDLIARASLREGSVAVVAAPTYAMYRIVSEQRGASVVAVPRLGPDGGFRPRHRRPGEGGPDGPAGLAVRAEQPDRRLRTARSASASCWPLLESDAARDGREPPTVAVDEAYAEFVGRSVLPLRSRLPEARGRSER